MLQISVCMQHHSNHKTPAAGLSVGSTGWHILQPEGFSYQSLKASIGENILELVTVVG
jgi:hypothetical protein